MTILDGGVLPDYEEIRSREEVIALNAQPTVANRVTAHGTILAAIAGAPVDGVGTVGVYPRAVLRSYTLPGFDDASIIAGLDAVTAAGPSVINISIGGPGFSQALYEAVLRAVDGGSIVVASAGNSPSGTAPDFYPADYPHVLTVGSTGRKDVPSSFSIRSPDVDLAAPGEEIPVLDPQNPADRPAGAGHELRHAHRVCRRCPALDRPSRPGRDAGDRASQAHGRRRRGQGLRREDGARYPEHSRRARRDGARSPIRSSRTTTCPWSSKPGFSPSRSPPSRARFAHVSTSRRIPETSTASSSPHAAP